MDNKEISELIKNAARDAGGKAAYEFFCKNLYYGEFTPQKWEDLDEETQEKWSELDDAYTNAFLDAARETLEKHVPRPVPESDSQRVYKMGQDNMPVRV